MHKGAEEPLTTNPTTAKPFPLFSIITIYEDKLNAIFGAKVPRYSSFWRFRAQNKCAPIRGNANRTCSSFRNC